MSWSELCFCVSSDHIDQVMDVLFAHDAASVSLEDAAAGTHEEAPVFGEPGMISGTLWDKNRVAALFPAHQNLDEVTIAVNALLGDSDPLRYTVGEVAETDWVKQVQAQFEPIAIAESLWVVPSWCDPPDPEAVNLRMDPGLAFGTGGHPTTRLCLRWLYNAVVDDMSVLDYGCGSGILSIAAMKLGAASTYGVDIDPVALEAARSNAVLNTVQTQFCLPDELPDLTFDCVLANILANPLIMLAPLLASRVKQGGWVVLSGLLDHQRDDLLLVYDSWFDMESREGEEGWACLIGRRR